jgi:hypothetical protein
MVPAPVTVKVLPEIDPGPEITLNVTPKLELLDAERDIGPTP